MNRVVTQVELNSGQQATTVVTLDHILVSVDDRACIAHRTWFDRVEAAELTRTLSVFANGVKHD